MTTTRQQRSPLGAMVRTPLGAFGQGATPPTLDWDVVVTIAEFREFLEGVPPTNPTNGLAYYSSPNSIPSLSCGTYTEEFDPSGPYPGAYRTRWNFSVQILPAPPVPDGWQYVGWTLTGDISQASYVIGSDAPTQECTSVVSQTIRETSWGTNFWDPAGPNTPLPLNSFAYYRLQSNLGGFDIEHAQGSVSLGFINGETCTLTP